MADAKKKTAAKSQAKSSAPAAQEKPTDMVRISHPKHKQTQERPTVVTRRAFERYLSKKGWRLHEKKGS